MFEKKTSQKTVDSSSNLCGGAKVWDRLIKGFPSLHCSSGLIKGREMSV